MIKVGDVFKVKVRPPIPDELSGGDPNRRIWSPELARKIRAWSEEEKLSELRVIRISTSGKIATVQEYDGLLPTHPPFEVAVAQLEEWEKGGSKY